MHPVKIVDVCRNDLFIVSGVIDTCTNKLIVIFVVVCYRFRMILQC